MASTAYDEDTIELPSGHKTFYHLSYPVDDAGQRKAEDDGLLVCFHGISQPGASSWSRLNKHMTENKNYRVLYFDFLGRGRSDSPVDVNYTGELFVTQAHELLTALNLVDMKFTLIGLSMGGAVAVMFTERYESVVERVVLIAPAGLPMQMPFMGKVATLPYFGDALMWLIGDKILSRGPHNLFRGKEAEHQDTIDIMVKTHREQMEYSNGNFLPAFLSTLRHFPLGGLKDEYISVAEKMGSRVLVLWGDNDDVVPYVECGLLAKEIMGKGRFVTYEDTGHGILHERRDLIFDEIVNFINEE
eukprot:TRINITY_DN8833_c0_g1_i1.p1 TRINITY_DN8833_c0_g1~~TRINITY_DN8833_c0_g1_i1.p1  ORF type:complete len:321 (+),score=50.15 TRINITY_DN8833_c0_g1_i1:59-964(+)